jgi:hypothetical protein
MLSMKHQLPTKNQNKMQVCNDLKMPLCLLPAVDGLLVRTVIFHHALNVHELLLLFFLLST